MTFSVWPAAIDSVPDTAFNVVEPLFTVRACCTMIVPWLVNAAVMVRESVPLPVAAIVPSEALVNVDPDETVSVAL